MKLFALVAIVTGEGDPRKIDCDVPQWLNDTDVKCSNSHHGGSYCSTSCPPGYESFVTECNCGRYCKWTAGKPYCFDPAEYDYYGNEEETGENTTSGKKTTTTTLAKSTATTTTTTSQPAEETSGDFAPGFPPRRSEKLKKKKEEKEPVDECKRYEWLGLASVDCTDGVKGGSKCKMIEGACKQRYVTTELTCKCETKKNGDKCKWTVGPKDRPLNSKGPKCVRGSKKGIKEDTCKEEMWFKSSFVKCTNGVRRGSSCRLNNCDDDEETNKTQCMCFERSKGVRKCRWNKKPKCKRTEAKKADKDKKEKERVEESETAPIEDVFRRLTVVQPECPNENWDYADAVQCTDGYRNGSTCQIQACSGKLMSSKSICSCHHDNCVWVHAHDTSEPTCRSRLTNVNVPDHSQMLMDAVVEEVKEEEEEEEAEIEEVEVTPAPIDYTAANPNVCMTLPDHGITLCSDRNRDGSYCRRLDCKSNETSCMCDSSGMCHWTAGAPICMEDAVLASGCSGGNCTGCDMDDWMFETATECNNFNHESSECYRSNCYYPLASTRAQCVCAENRRGDKFCYWDSIPLCFSPALF